MKLNNPKYAIMAILLLVMQACMTIPFVKKGNAILDLSSEFDVKNEEPNILWWMKDDLEEITKELLSDENQSWTIADEQIQSALQKEEYKHLKEVYVTSYVDPYSNTLYLVLTNTTKTITEQFESLAYIKNYEHKIISKTPIASKNNTINDLYNNTKYVSITKEYKTNYKQVNLIFRKGLVNQDTLQQYKREITEALFNRIELKNVLSGIGTTENGTILIMMNEVTRANLNIIESSVGDLVPPSLIQIRKCGLPKATSFPGRQELHDPLIGGIKIVATNATHGSSATLGYLARNLDEDEIGIISAGHIERQGGGDIVYQPNWEETLEIGEIDEFFNDSYTDGCWIELDERTGLSKIYNNTSTQILVDEECRPLNNMRAGMPVWFNGAFSDEEQWAKCWVTDYTIQYKWHANESLVVEKELCLATASGNYTIAIPGDSGSPVYRKRYDTYADVWRAEPIGIVTVNFEGYPYYCFTSLDRIQDAADDTYDFRLDRDFSEFTHQGSGSFTYSDYNQDNHITTLYNNEDAWDYEDKGVGYFDEWYAELTVDADSHGTKSGGAFLFALSDEINDWQDIDDGIGLYLTYAKGAGEWRLFLKTRQNGDTTDSDYYTTDTALKRVTIEKDGTDIYAYIYDNVNRTMYEDTLHVTMNSDQSYRYVFSVMSNNSGKSGAYLTGDVTEFAYWPINNK